MPKTAIDYQKTIIYKLCCKDPTITDIYVGHTTDFNNRKRNHKARCNNPNVKNYNLYVYQFIRENGNWENWDMIQLEAYFCKDRREAETRERYFIETLKSSLNKQLPTQTIEEWREKNKDYYSEYNKNYYEQHKDYYNEHNKNYYEQNKEQFAEKNKNYYEQNKEQFAEKNKNYYEQNKEKYKEKAREKMTCECGSFFSFSNKSNHNKSIKHQDYLNSINSSEKSFGN